MLLPYICDVLLIVKLLISQIPTTSESRPALSASEQLQKANPINSSNDIYLCIPKSTHHPTNKKPHEVGLDVVERVNHLSSTIFLVCLNLPACMVYRYNPADTG